MEIFINIILLIVGFVLLIKGADAFVDGAVSVATKLGVPALIIGLTIVSIGTSAPELVTSIVAAIQGSSELAIGNAVGSNIFNLLFIVGVCAMAMPFYMNVKSLYKDLYISVLAALILFVLMFIFQDRIPRYGSAILAICFVIYIVQLVVSSLKSDVVNEEIENKLDQRPFYQIIIFLILGVIGIVIGSQLIVRSAVTLASMIGISPRVIGLTVVALGTSLPELTVSFNAFKKQENGIALGNIVGSNIFNILFVLGIAGSITPLVPGGVFDLSTVQSFMHTPLFDLAFLIAVSIMFIIFLKVSSGLNRIQAGVMLVLYIAYTTMLIIN
jgi:cation:H+ antiporter